MALKKIFLGLLFFAAGVNFIAALGPELGFDALWYHLTIPKIYLMWGKIDFIPGGLLYYSAMPRLGEFLFSIGDLGAHLINWFAGIGTAFITYKLARKYLTENYALLAAVIFYVTPLVGWQSGSAYVDLLRSSFEVLAFYLLISKKPFFSGIVIGLAISIKTLALGSLGIFLVLNYLQYKNFKTIFKFLIPVVLISAPWFIWSWSKTGYPFYPIGSGGLDATHALGIFTWWKIFPDSDPITPIYLILLPFFFFSKKPRELTLYVVLSYLVWWLTPRTGGGRFLLPYLPVWAVLAAVIINQHKKLILVAVLISIINVGYRVAANIKVLPYLFNKESKSQYLCKNLDFSTQVFYDCDGWFKNNIKKTDLVLIKGYHNLYYVDFPFIHETWYENQYVNYILTYREKLNLKMIYENDLTGARVYIP